MIMIQDSSLAAATSNASSRLCQNGQNRKPSL